MKKIYKYIFILALFLLASPIYASTCGVTSTGGNWNSAGTWFNCAGAFPISGDDVVATSTSGNVVVNANTNLLKSFDFSTYGGTLSGASQIIVRGLAATTQNIKFGGTVTWTGNLNIQPVASSANIDITTNGKLMTAVLITAGSASTIRLLDNMSFAAVKTASLSWGLTGTFDMNGFTISGNSATNRVQIKSGTLGTQRTITISGGTFANADFMDIALDTSTNLSAITGLSGDCGGNSNITFTTATTTYWIGNTGSWSNTAEWSWGSGLAGSTTRVPLPQDTVVFDSNSFSGTGFTVTADMPRAGGDVSFALVGTDNPTLTFTTNLVWSIFGSLVMDSGMTWTNISGVTPDFAGRNSGQIIDMQSISVPRPVTMSAPGGDYSLANDWISLSTFTQNAGTLNAVSYNFTSGSFSQGNFTSVFTNMGSGTWNVTSTANAWDIKFNATLDGQTSTLIMSNTTATLKTWGGGSKTTYNNVTFAGPNIVTSGNNTINGTMAINNAGFNTTLGLRFTSLATTTVANITTNATTTSDRSMASTTSSTASAGLVKTGGGTICLDYINLQRLNANPVSTFYALSNSLDSGNNTNWTFGACPAPAKTSEDTDLEFY